MTRVKELKACTVVNTFIFKLQLSNEAKTESKLRIN